MRSKLAQLAAVATLSLLLSATALPKMASAAKDGQQAFAASDSKKSSKSSKASKSKKHVTTKKTVVHKKVVVHKHVQPSHRSRVVIRTTAQYVPLVVIGPRVTYRAYGSGWCRALHRGRHWAPGLGWHSGRHIGRVRC
jgi:hypothetical protein